jgi:drug/metabolite transporter (DMT)-like permease
MSVHRLKAYALLIATSIIWGIASPVIKFTLRGIDPITFLTYRFFISTVLGLIVLLIGIRQLKKIKDNFLEVLIYSLFATTISLGLLFIGLSKTTLLDTILITAVSPLATAIAGLVFLNEVITRQERIGIAIAFTGTLITIVEPLVNGTTHISQLSGNLLVVGYLITNAISAVYSKKLMRKDVDSFALSNTSFIIGFLALIPISLIISSPSQIINTAQTLSLPYQLGVWYMALISGTIGYALWVKGQKTIEISEAGVFAYLMPLFSTPLAVFWLGEQIKPPFIIGAIFISVGVFIAEYKKRRTD